VVLESVKKLSSDSISTVDGKNPVFNLNITKNSSSIKPTLCYNTL
jgi:hypothetical protein